MTEVRRESIFALVNPDEGELYEHFTLNPTFRTELV